MAVALYPQFHFPIGENSYGLVAKLVWSQTGDYNGVAGLSDLFLPSQPYFESV